MPVPSGGSTPGSGGAAQSLASAAELEAVLQVELAPATADLLLEGATAIVQAIVGQQILQGTSTVNLDGDGSRWLWLPQIPVISVASVSVGGVLLGIDGWSQRGNRLYRPWGWGPDVEVTYTHGFPPGDPALQLARSAALSIAAGMYGTGAFGSTAEVQSERIDDYEVRFEKSSTSGTKESGDGTLPTTVRHALLRRYGRGAGTVSVGIGGL